MHLLMVHLVLNIIFSEFLLFPIYVSCWIQAPRFGQDVLAHEGVFDQRALLE